MIVSPDLIPYLFGGLMLLGVLYFLYSMVFGGDFGGDIGAEASEFGCTVIAAFCAAFGAVGLLGWLSGWGLALTLGVAAVVGLVLGRVILVVLRAVARQQSTDVVSVERLIGSSARMTIDTPAGKVGEAIVEDRDITKYPVRNVADSVLTRGDHVEIVDVQNGTLYVKKKRAG